MSTILQIANADRNLHLLIKGLKAASLDEKLSGSGPFTLLAPINLAFRNLPGAESFENLIEKAGNKNRLTEILSYHVLMVKKLVKDFRDGQKFQTAQGNEVTVTIKEGQTYINGAKILARDMQGSNGVIHSINAVNLPG